MATFHVNEDKNLIVCTSCGAHFSIKEAKCPYCGAFNPVGAEEEYMGKLYDIKDDTENLPDLAQDEVEEDLVSNSKKTIRFVGIILIIAFALIVLATALGNRSQDRAMTDYKEMEAFKEEYFDEFNRLYEEEKDDEFCEYSLSLLKKPGYDAIYKWEHYGYYRAYFDYCDIKEWSDLYSSTGKPEDKAYAVSTALDLTRDAYYLETPYYTFSERDMERIEEYQAYAEEFLKDELKMTSSEIDAWVEELKGTKGYIDRKDLREYIKKIDSE